jgi:hypothetical protein
MVTIIEKTEDQFREKASQKKRELKTNRLKQIMVDTLNVCNLDKVWTIDNIHAYNSPVSEVIKYKETKITVRLSSHDDPRFSCIGTKSSDFINAAEFVQLFEDAYLAVSL